VQLDPASPYSVSIGQTLTLAPPPGNVVGVELINVGYAICLVNMGGVRGYLAASAYRALSLPAPGTEVDITVLNTPGVTTPDQIYVAWLYPDDQPDQPGTFTPASLPVVVQNFNEVSFPVTDSAWSQVLTAGTWTLMEGTNESAEGLYTYVGTVSIAQTAGSEPAGVVVLLNDGDPGGSNSFFLSLGFAGTPDGASQTVGHLVSDGVWAQATEPGCRISVCFLLNQPGP
jgi:hypothetical protein